MTVEQAGLDRAECAVLNLSRCFFCSFSEPMSQAWQHAIVATNGAKDFGLGAAQLGLVLEMVLTMRRTRRSCFQFNSPFCEFCSEILSEHERQLIGTLAAFREGRHGSAKIHAMLLCEGNDATQFLNATFELAKTMSKVADAHRNLLPSGAAAVSISP